MPLQIRRGTDAERSAMTQPLAAGELIYVTNTQRLFVGNGATVGGVGVTGYTDIAAQDAAATIFTNNTNHTGISFSYNGTTHEISASVDLTAFEGLIEADLKGSVFADDSTLLVDGVSGRIVGPVFANVTGNLIGDVTGNLTVSSLLTLQNGSSITSTADAHPGGAAAIRIGTDITPVSVVRYSNATHDFQYGISTGPQGNNGLRTRTSRGTALSPIINQLGDQLHGIESQGWSGSQWKTSSGILFSVSSVGSITDNNVPGAVTIYTVEDANLAIAHTYQFGSTGTLTLKNIKRTGLTIAVPEYITVLSTSTYNLSTTTSENILLITSSGYSATINMPLTPVDGQIAKFVVIGNSVTLVQGTGIVLPTFANASVPAGTSATYIYRMSNTSWYKLS